MSQKYFAHFKPKMFRKIICAKVLTPFPNFSVFETAWWMNRIANAHAPIFNDRATKFKDASEQSDVQTQREISYREKRNFVACCFSSSLRMWVNIFFFIYFWSYVKWCKWVLTVSSMKVSTWIIHMNNYLQINVLNWK